MRKNILSQIADDIVAKLIRQIVTEKIRKDSSDAQDEIDCKHSDRHLYKAGRYNPRMREHPIDDHLIERDRKQLTDTCRDKQYLNL